MYDFQGSALSELTPEPKPDRLLAKATLVKARCLRALDNPAEAVEAIFEALRLLSPLADRHRAKLRRELRELLDELGAIDRKSLQLSPAAEIAALLDASNDPMLQR